MSTPTARPTEREPLVRVRVWDAPVRVIHWLLVLALAVLSVTGFLIGTPSLVPHGDVDWVAWTRGVHRVSAYVLIALVVARVLWLFLSPNPWSRWTQWIPSRRARLKEVVPSVRFYLFLEREAPPVTGHNPLAGLTYTLFYAMLGVEILTGLALWGVEGVGWAAWLTGWLRMLVALPVLRFIHHLIMWLVWGFMIHHVYSAMLVDRVERSGLISSIFSGFKFLPRDRAPGTDDGERE